MIIIDSREKENSHIIKVFDKLAVEYKKDKLDFGDYISDNYRNKYVIERKASLIEFAGNCGKGHNRFKAELERCKKAGYRMIILIEEKFKYEDLQSWKNHKSKYGYIYKKDGSIVPRRTMTGEQMYKICNEWKSEYNCLIFFCNKNKSAEIILNTLR